LTIIDGYFQTEKYFIEISKVLRNEFKFNSEPLGENLYYYNSIKKNSTATVSIHVRKYDNPHTVDVSSINGNCTIEYYNDAIDYFIMKFRDVIFYAFSDDMNWLKSNINFKNQVIHYVDHNHSQNAYEDLRLMSICDHNIIANSSFSWWGAWLNHNPNKIIIAPKVWLLANEFDYSDVIPEKWIKI
jgi:hypothetical protein